MYFLITSRSLWLAASPSHHPCGWKSCDMARGLRMWLELVELPVFLSFHDDAKQPPLLSALELPTTSSSGPWQFASEPRALPCHDLPPRLAALALASQKTFGSGPRPLSIFFFALCLVRRLLVVSTDPRTSRTESKESEKGGQEKRWRPSPRARLQRTSRRDMNFSGRTCPALSPTCPPRSTVTRALSPVLFLFLFRPR